MNEIYRKYSERFSVQTAALSRAEFAGKLAHAYIIYSDNVNIREEYSTLLAQIAACPESSDGIPCGVCAVCRQLAEGSYSELFTLMPNSKSRQIRIGENEHDLDTLRWFQSRFYVSSTGAGRRKIGIISYADCMNNEAQNAFLKTLEEPPRDTVLILNTPNPASLLPTMISRCHTITLLENRCDYNFSWTQDVTQVLYRLQSCTSGHLAVGCEAADKLIEISGRLNREAEERVLPLWEKRLADAENPDIQWSAAQKRRVKERYEAAVASEYRYLRGIFLSLIHSWFAQNYQIACGADTQLLSNPELYFHIDTEKLHHILDEDKTLLQLKKAEALLQNLRWNVREELAFREFCCAVTV